MKWSLSRWVAIAVFAVWVVLAIGGVALLALTWNAPKDVVFDSGVSSAVGVLVECAFAGVGLLLATRLPRNAIGWLFLVIAITTTLSFSLARYAVYAVAHRGSLPGGTVAATLAQSVWVILIGSVALLLLTFPSGALPSRRWRFVPVLLVAGAGAVFFSGTTAPGPLPKPFAAYDNPLGVTVLRRVDGVLLHGWPLLLVGMIAGAVSLIYRYRRAEGIERQQLKLFACGAVAFPLASIAANVFESTSVAATVSGILAGLTALFLPLATAIAILRYRLYDFDRVISRTIAYVLLTTVLAAAYAGLVLLGERVFSSFAGGSALAVAASTLVVAALFQPLRKRVQHVVDRRFNRRRYDAEATVAAFGARLREQVDLAELAVELRKVVGETMQPSSTSLWLKEPA